MKIKIVIADTDERYAKRLFEALQRHDNLFLAVYTDKECFNREVISSKYDIALIDASIASDITTPKSVKLPIFLYDEESTYRSGIDLSKYKTIKKYQRAENIYKEIIGIYSEVVSDSYFLNKNNKQSQVICFYSPVGGAGKTVISIAAANSVANMGKKVLYMNLESIASYGVLMKQKGGKGISEAFSALDGSMNFELKLESLLQKTPQRVMYFEKFESLLDIYEITPDDIEKFVRAIQKTGKADYIIIDMSSEFNYLNMRIMDISDKIVLVERHDEISMEKLNSFMEQKSVKLEYKEKMLSVVNFSSRRDDRSRFELVTTGAVKYIEGGVNDLISNINRLSLIDVGTIIQTNEV